MPVLRRYACVFLFLTSVTSLATAQQQPTRNPAAVSVVVQSLHAMGATGNAFPVTDAVVTAQVTSGTGQNQTSHPITIQIKGPDHVRIDHTGDTPASFVAKGEVGRAKDGKTARAVPTTVALARSRIEQIPVLLLAGEFFRTDTSFSYVGQETIDGRPNHHVSIQRLPPGNAQFDLALSKAASFEVLIDAQALTVTELRYNSPAVVDWRITFPVAIHYANYVSMQGLLVPTRIMQVFVGRQTWTLEISNAVFNQGVADAAFDLR